MNVITIENDAYQEIIRNINEIKESLNKRHTQSLSEQWLDISDTCRFLHISKRTLQNYRDKGVLPFSKIGGKIYFRASDLDERLKKHYHKGF